MNVSSLGDQQQVLAKRPRVPVRGSSVVVEIPGAALDSELSPDALRRIVRCAACDCRLFDLTDGQPSWPTEERTLVVTRKCLACGLLNEGRVTPIDGRRIFGPGVLVGPWICECGQSLGTVDEIRGRITVTCRRCKHKRRVTAVNAFVAASPE
jgi:hypothetical protein